MEPSHFSNVRRPRSLCRTSWIAVVAGVVLCVATGCTPDQDPLFSRLDSEQTGVDFVNTIATNDSLMNPVDFFYVYNGGGVAAGDVNGDGRTDLYFSGNTVSNRLYLNQGDFEFHEVTEEAGVRAEGVWATGVTLVDINQDGRTDIYVSVGGPRARTEDRENRLYVNQGVGADGVPTFEEQAEAYGIADAGYSTHAAFFDYDRDGDLDLYVLNTASVQRGPSIQRGGASRNDGGQDRLYRKEGDGSFTEVTEEAGIGGKGFGLGLAISDVNGDGWPDIYAANDLYTRDRLYVNQGDGTFVDRSKNDLRHQSLHPRGVDVADVDNDGWNDILTVDMLPQEAGQYRLLGGTVSRRDSMWQYRRNALQLNNGMGPNGLAPFSEIGQLARVEATGWSWAPLLADYDNDGDRDLFVSNGYGPLVTHPYFIERRKQLRRSREGERSGASLYQALEKLPRGEVSNRFFENVGLPNEEGDGGVRFADRTAAWSRPQPGISNGAAFADLDRDGDLDLVTNNVNREATILENHADERADAHALRVDLHGPEGNRSGVGAKVTVADGATTQYQDYSPYRGYQSTVEGLLHFGLGADSTADSLSVVWPDGTTQVRTQVEAGRVLDVHYDSTEQREQDRLSEQNPGSTTGQRSRLFRQVDVEQRGIAHRHRDFPVPDFQTNPLLPHRYSQNGPGIAVGDVDGNGLDDVFVGADPKRKRVLYRQVEPGQFQQQPLAMGQIHEDMGALFFDANGDGDQDLYVVSGGNVLRPGNPRNTYQDRLYLNDGSGRLRRAKGALPDITASGSVVTAADYDEDGDQDLFVGGRVQARQYPLPPRSYLLRNDSGKDGVRFTDVTAEVVPELVDPGLVTDALWTDFNGDGQVDLIVVGEWMRIRFFENKGGTFTEVTDDAGLQNTSGWWNSLAAGDFDRDGDTDYVVANFGLNSRYEPSPEEPIRIYAKDFDQDEAVEPVLTRSLEGTEYPIHEREDLLAAFRGMLPRIPSHRAYADASFEDLFTREERRGAYEAEAVRFTTSFLENQGDGTFELRPLPQRTQMAPIFGMRAGDYTGDGVLDLLMVGNWYAPNRETGRADAFIGAVLKGEGDGTFTPISVEESGFFVEGDAKGLAEVAVGDEASFLITTQNDDSIRAFAPNRPRRSIPVEPFERYAILTYADGATQKVELYDGGTYLSQSSNRLYLPAGVEKVVIHGREGTRRSLRMGEENT